MQIYIIRDEIQRSFDIKLIYFYSHSNLSRTCPPSSKRRGSMAQEFRSKERDNSIHSLNNMVVDRKLTVPSSKS